VWRARLTEWGVVLALVIVLAAVLGYQWREVRAQAELAHVQSTLGALRTALVVAHLKAAVDSARKDNQSPAPLPRNPFAVLEKAPPNYAGLADPQRLAALPGGSWVYDPGCGCIGYSPLEAGRLEAPQNAGALWFRVGSTVGPPHITAQQVYVWMGQAVE
jgi:hypothetical protein